MKRASIKKLSKTDDRKPVPLDLSTVRTTNEKVERTRPRIFGLTEAPTYYPTTEEFKDPLKYIRQIRKEAEQYGIIKIVPPKEYKPEFCLNTENFRFRTRIQKLNSMEGETRANLNYLDQIQKFHRSQGKPMHRIPQLDKRPIDLYRLKKEVAQKGGYQQVTQQKKWAEIGRVLGYTRRQCTSMSNALKNAYSKVVLPYESWLEEQKERSTPISLNIKDNITNNDDNDDDDDDDNDNDSDESNQNCEICQKDDKADELLLCDDCDRGYHMSCLSPPLTSIPAAEWYCLKCLTAVGSDYGFEDGDEYSLSDFQTFCDNFKKAWFSKYKPVLHASEVSEEDCEEEFWRLVDDPHETCQVEYGADLHSTQHGSGFASAERNMDKEKRNDPWNLNMIPILPDSLFTHIKTDISGMMVPWLYIGMCFTTFCWHNEDHYTYSINYMHWGETKTWYGIPGGDTAKFEDTMKKAVPELFEQDPNLLFRLVTMLSPGRLLKENVKVYAVDQRPGEFVVTFPKAYHSGFNHGFNFCEAVNFAPDDWVDFGLECVKRYKEYRHQPCFSHDELLVNTAKMDLTPKNASWLKYALYDMQQREMGERHRFQKKHPNVNIKLDNSLNEELQCLNCHCYTYLSYITCPCTKKVACLDHIEELCACDDTRRTLCLRFSDNELTELVEMAREVSRAPSVWNEKARQILSSGNLPNADTIRNLLHEAEKERVTEDETRQLSNFLTTIEKWEKDASKYLNINNDDILKATQQVDDQQSSKYDSSLFNQYDEMYNTILKNKKRYQHLIHLINETDNMAFDSIYIPQLKQLLDNIHEFKKDAAELLKKKDDHIPISDLQRMFYRGLLFQMKIDEIESLRLIIQQYRWMYELEPTAMSLPLDYDTIHELVKEAEKCKISTNHPKYKAVLNKARLGEGWLKHAQRLLPNGTEYEHATMEDLDEVLNVDQDIPTQRDIYQELQGLRVRASEFFDYFNRTIMQCQQFELLNRPIANDINELLMQMEQFPPAMVNDPYTLLKNELNRHDAWTTKLKRLFAHRNSSTKALGSMLQDTKENIQNILVHHQKKKDHPIITTATSSSTKKQNKSSDAYCLCHEPESGFMVNCDHCQDWYHGTCVKITRKQIQTQASYICPVCDPPHDIVEASSRPSIEDLTDILDEVSDFLFVPTVYSLAKEILDIVTVYRNDVRAFCRSKTKLDHDDLYMIKQYLRELLGLHIMLADETEFLCRKVRELSPITHHHYLLQKNNNNNNNNNNGNNNNDLSTMPSIDQSQYINHHHHSSPSPPSLSSSSSSSSSQRPTIKLTIKPPLITQSPQSHHHHHHNDSSSLLDKKRKHSIDDSSKRRSKRETNIINYSSTVPTGTTNTFINNNDAGSDGSNNLQNTSHQPFKASFYY